MGSHEQYNIIDVLHVIIIPRIDQDSGFYTIRQNLFQVFGIIQVTIRPDLAKKRYFFCLRKRRNEQE